MSDSSSETGKERVNSEEDDNFVWQDYLEMTSAEEVPHMLFPHVEQSLKSSLQEGMMLEVPDKTKTNTYWPAVIKMSCGPLLSLCYMAPEKSRVPEFWCDLGQVAVQPLGWCAQQKDPKVTLAPPEQLVQAHPNEDWKELASKGTLGKLSVPAELLQVEGYTAIERIKQGMRVEVQDEKNPLHHWVATIIENVGGRLLLRYDALDSSLPDFWLFYTSTRLFRLGWVDENGLPWQYRPPSSTELSQIEEEEWGSVLETAKLEAELLPPPPDLFQGGEQGELPPGLKAGMKLEAVHPLNRVEVCPATVTRTFSTGHFLVQIDCEGDQHLSWLCGPGDPCLFPPGWCKKNGLRLTHPRGWTSALEDFDWEEYLAENKALPAPDSCFMKYEDAQALGFEPGLKLEAVNPEQPHQVCAASVSKTCEHLVWLHLDSRDSFHPAHIVSTDSTDIFPVGWCGSNSYPLKPPLNYQAVCQTRGSDEGTAPPSLHEVSQKSSWCPKIFFNHKCFTGPFLSKGKLAQLPKAVGPGPVTLVLREVLSMLISVAYKSRQVLKELQCEGATPQGMHIEVLKAKLKSAVYRANVGIATSADQVPGFCRDVCSKLQSCPNLFGPQLFEGSCPVGCSALSKSRFTNYWSKNKRSHAATDTGALKQKKRGRKKLLTRSKSRGPGAPHEDEHARIEEVESESPSRPESQTSDSRKRAYKKKLFPQFEMRTRGAKLPNFALQMANWTWGKDDNYVPGRKKSRLASDATNVSKSSTDKPVGSKRRGRPPLNLSRSANLDKISRPGLESNPMSWSVADVSRYLRRTPDCGCVAKRLADEDIDGHAFMLLNLPTIQENLQIQLGPAIKLCQHIERVKYAYFSDFYPSSKKVAKLCTKA